MKRFVVFCLAGAFLFSACGSHDHNAPPNKQDSLSAADSAKNTFFPIADFVESEILRVDSTPLALRKYVTLNGKTDSAFIQVPEFNALAFQFLLPEFKNGSFEKKYTESSFMDKTTQSVMMTYSTADNTLPLQRVDVMATPFNGSQQVRSIYFEKTRVSGDSMILQKMYWRSKQSFQVINSIRVKGGPPVDQQLKVVWDTGEEE
jgi:hypothetical protein